jgi:hypothetical protein
MANKINPGDVVPLREALNLEIVIKQAKIEEIRKEMPSVIS